MRRNRGEVFSDVVRVRFRVRERLAYLREPRLNLKHA